ncbi:MAG TPA: IS21 family transposase [Bacteroidia bacterium]|jgi:transposase|nr:IS21 family transposase [Bacteroidia bacterium]
MSNIRYILRLHTQGINFFEIIKQTGIFRASLRKHIDDFNQSGLTFEEINVLSDKDLEELFQVPVEKPVNARLQTMLDTFPKVQKELKRKGVTQKMLWRDYIKEHPDGYDYIQFNSRYRKWSTRPLPVLHKEHKAGDKMYIDFAGQKLSIIDPTSGMAKDVEVFVAILGASQLTYVEAVMSQKKEDFIPACENALQFFGGVPAAIVCDNLRAAVKRASRYEPSINDTFSDFGEHYNTAIIPTRPHKPTDKALVEIAVRITYSRIYTQLTDRKIYSLEELNKAILAALEEHNDQIITGKGISRRKLFDEMEKSTLLPLPLLRYEFKKQTYKDVPRHCHVSIPSDKHYYSVPYKYIGKSVKILYSSHLVEIFYHFELIATYKRDRTPCKYTTDNSHLFPSHRYTTEMASDRFIAAADSIHKDVREYINKVLESQRHRDQAYRICTGVLGFAKKVGNDRLTKACQRAASYGIYNYNIIRKILVQGLDMCENESEQLKMPEHNNIRGKDYYQ